MKKIVLSILFLPLNITYSMNENNSINRLALLPLEIQDHITHLVPFTWLETDEESLAALDQQHCATHEKPFETKSYKISIDTETGNVTYFDKKSATSEDLIAVNNSYRKDNKLNSAIFALSPNGKKGVFETSHLFINTENNKQNKLVIADLETKQTHFMDVSSHFPERIVSVLMPFKNVYEQLGYEQINAITTSYKLPEVSHYYFLKCLFTHIAISNDGLIATIDKSNSPKYQQSCIDVLNPQNNTCVELERFENTVSIKSMRFNAQGTKLFVKLQDKDNSHVIKSYTIKKLEKSESRKSLLDYLHNKSVCNKENFFKNNVPE